VVRVAVLKDGQRHEGEVPDGSNLVVRAGIKAFPFPHLSYGCGMGKCGKCACQVVSGMEHLPGPNWKETKILGDRIAVGMRLMCQLWLQHDIELSQGTMTGEPA
jgi:ferredoxin